MKQVLWQLDFLSAILFLIVCAVSGSAHGAAGIALAAVRGSSAWLKFAGPRIEPMQWVSPGLV
jgi:intracellular septation protein A